MTPNKPHVHAAAIKAWADGAAVQIEMIGGSWTDHPSPSWSESMKYRVKPRVPREFFVNLYPNRNDRGIHDSQDAADRASHADRMECIKVREVIE